MSVSESSVFCPCQPVVVAQHGAAEVAGVVHVALDSVGSIVALKPGVGGVHVASQCRVAVEVVVVVVPPAVTTVATVAAVGSPAVPQIPEPGTADTDCASHVVVVTVIIVVVVLVI